MYNFIEVKEVIIWQIMINLITWLIILFQWSESLHISQWFVFTFLLFSSVWLSTEILWESVNIWHWLFKSTSVRYFCKRSLWSGSRHCMTQIRHSVVLLAILGLGALILLDFLVLSMLKTQNLQNRENDRNYQIFFERASNYVIAC